MRPALWFSLAMLPCMASAEVHVEIRAADPPPSVEVSAVRDGDDSPAVTVETSTPQASLDLEPGEWTITAVAAGYWPTAVSVELASRSEHESVTLDLWPTGWLEGGLQGPSAEELPKTLDLTFRPSPAESLELPGASVTCPVEADRWSCELPAGRLDVFVGAKGFIRQYLWDVAVPVGESVALPEAVPLRRGSVVRGWVTTEDGTAIENATIELAPRTATDPRKETVERIRARKLSMKVTDRGFFQLDGLIPGAYVVTASKEGYAPTQASVRVLEDQATEINDPPLVLGRPRTLEIYIDPPTPPIGEAWMAELSRIDRQGGPLAETVEGVVPPGGAWRIEGIADGQYFLDVRTTEDREESRGGVPAWHGQSLEVGADTAQIFVTIPVVAVTGRLTLGKEPLPGELVFGTRHGLPRRTLVVDEEGVFTGWLPRSGVWEIDVLAEELSIVTTVQREIENGADLEIEIPKTHLSGQVIRENRDPAARAIVYIRSQSQRTEIFADDAGVFEAIGLPEGSVSLHAAHHRLKSGAQLVTLDEDSERSVVLVVRPVTSRTGRVIGPAGAGVAGAQVTALVAEDVLNPLPPSGITDEDGNFELDLPKHARSLLLAVAAPGFAFRAFRASALEEPLMIPVSQESGTLNIELPPSYDPRRWDSPKVVVLHGSGASYLIQLVRWAAMNGRHQPDWPLRTVAPLMEPGPYSICWAVAGELAALMVGSSAAFDCESGELAASGELTLTLEEPSSPD